MSPWRAKSLRHIVETAAQQLTNASLMPDPGVIAFGGSP
jgi:hypothetical protein